MNSTSSSSGTPRSPGDSTPDPPASTSPRINPIAAWIATIACVFAILPTLHWITARIAWPFGSLDPEIVGALARTGNSKPEELGFFALMLVSSITLAPWFVRRWRCTFDPPDSAALVAFALAMLAGALGVANLREPATLSTAGRPIAVLLMALIAGTVWRALERAAPWRDRLARRAQFTLALIVITLPVMIFVLSVGPRTAGDLTLSRAMLRVVACGMGSFIVLGGLIAIVSALVKGPNAPVLALCTGRQLGWLAFASFAPRNPWIVGGAIAIALVGMAWEGRRCLRTQSLPRDLLGHVCCVVFPILVLNLANVDDPHGAIDFFHLGETATLAQTFLDGRLPYVDFYVQHGFMRNVGVPAISMELLGSSIAAERLGESVVRAITHLAAYSLCRCLLGSRLLALVLALACATPGLWFPDRFLPLFLFLSATLRGLGLAHGRQVADTAPRQLEFAGLLAVACFAWSVDSGVYALATLTLVIGFEAFARRDRSTVGFELRAMGIPALRGLAFGLLGFATLLVATSGFRGTWESIENFARQTALQLSTWGLPFPQLFDRTGLVATSAALRSVLTAAVFLLSLTAWFASGFRSGRSLLVRQCAIVSILGLCVFRTALGRSDDAHLQYPLPFALLIATAFAQHTVRSTRDGEARISLHHAWRFAPAAILLAYVVTAFTPVYGAIRQWIDLSTVRAFEATSDHAQLELPRLGGVMIPRPQAQFLATLHAELEERLGSSETFFDFSNMGALYFLFDRPCPTRYVAPVYAATTEMQRELISDLERTKPPLAFSCRSFGYEAVDGIPMNERAPLVGAYLKTNYDQIVDLGFGWLLIRTTP